MNIPAKKSLGQNFLKDETILKRIADSIETQEDDFIIEIGPGKGALTKYLLQKKGDFLAYEIDERMKPILNSLSTSIIYDDFLRRNLKEDLAKFHYNQLFVIANIPYYITTPILEHIISSNIEVDSMTLLVQREVADRFAAKPKSKDYGYFTVFLNYYFEVTKLFDVSRNSFIPIPNVDSTVVMLKKREQLTFDTKKYFSFLKEMFRQKRKVLKNNLNRYDWEKIKIILNKYHLSESVRAEELEIPVIQEIFCLFY